MKEKEQNKPSPYDEIASLKKQVAGLKGYNKQLRTANENAENELEKVSDALSTANEGIANLMSDIKTMSRKKSDLTTTINNYNNLPWWRKIFVFKLG